MIQIIQIFQTLLDHHAIVSLTIATIEHQRDRIPEEIRKASETIKAFTISFLPHEGSRREILKEKVGECLQSIIPC
jgi:RNase P/RNase MRP subunit POP5